MKRAKASGRVILLWPQSHLSVKTYWPKLSDSFLIESGGRGGIMRGLSRHGTCRVHPVSDPVEYCMWWRPVRTARLIAVDRTVTALLES
jgi:hypothetical protein